VIMLVPLLGLAGLGAACSVTPWTPEAIYQLAISAGFPDDPVGQGVATDMTAISLRENGGCPTAHYQGANPLVPTEDSYGLWAINAQAIGSAQLAKLGITNPTQLYDPATNAMVANWIYQVDGGNLDTAWYINHGGSYTSQYQAELPIASAAALAVSGGSGDALASSGGGTDFLGLSSDSASSSSFAQSLGLSDEQLVLGGIGILALLGFAAALA
jgi:hypothetical protein